MGTFGKSRKAARRTVAGGDDPPDLEGSRGARRRIASLPGGRMWGALGVGAFVGAALVNQLRNLPATALTDRDHLGLTAGGPLIELAGTSGGQVLSGEGQQRDDSRHPGSLTGD
jgi:hypothetical protein